MSEATLDYPSTVTTLWGVLGQGGYEGIQNDQLRQRLHRRGRGGPAGTVNTHAKQPNSFLFRFLPNDPTQPRRRAASCRCCRSASLAHPGPIVFHAGQADADILSQDVADLHTYGKTFTTLWVTIHDTAKDGTAAFDANAAAKKAGGTPFKRPENGQFEPGTKFKKFFFDETGDTTLTTEAGADYGGFGAVRSSRRTRRATRARCGSSTCRTRRHSSFDNVTFFDKKHVIFVQDQGDGLHSALNALDSALPVRRQARLLGRRAASEGPRRGARSVGDDRLGDRRHLGNGFQNEGDNEITGIHESNGDPTADGLLGAAHPEGPSSTAGGSSSRTSTATT